MNKKLAEGVGFEPTDAFTSLVFKTRAIDHSATLPRLVVSAAQRVRGRFFDAGFAERVGRPGLTWRHSAAYTGRCAVLKEASA